MAKAAKATPKRKPVGKTETAAKATAKPAAIDKLAGIGLEAICERIESGESQAEISKAVGVNPAALSQWLNLPSHEKRSARAREASAEAWLDRGLQPLKDALDPKAKIDAAAARAYEQACARRAALRNPRYVEKTAHELSGPNGGPIPMSAASMSDEQLALIASGSAKRGTKP